MLPATRTRRRASHGYPGLQGTGVIAERQVLDDQNALVQAQTAAGTSLIAIYKALGAGWPLEQQVAR